MSKLVVSAKFAEVGLKVSRNTAARPRVTVQDVDTSVGPDEFMMELKEKNFGEMSLKEFQKVVVLATKPWSAADGATVNVTLEVDDQALAVLEGGRLYVKWFSYRCRSQVRTYDTDASDLTTRSATVSTPERSRSAASMGRTTTSRRSAEMRWTAATAVIRVCPRGIICFRVAARYTARC